MRKIYTISLVGLLGGLVGFYIGINIAIHRPNYYSVETGAYLGWFQGLSAGIILGTMVCFWNPVLKKYWKVLTQSKFRRWCLISAACFLMPILVFSPYRFYVFVFARNAIVTPRIGWDHQNIHLTVWFIYTFLPFSFFSFVSGIVCLIKALKVRKSESNLISSPSHAPIGKKCRRCRDLKFLAYVHFGLGVLITLPAILSPGKALPTSYVFWMGLIYLFLGVVWYGRYKRLQNQLVRQTESPT